MLLQVKTVTWPSQAEVDADLNEYGHISLRTRAIYGQAAVEAGTPDAGGNGFDADGVATDCGDAIANILHAIRDTLILRGESVAVVDATVKLALDRGRRHFEAEAAGLE